MKVILLLLALVIASQAAVQKDLVTNLTEQTGYKLPWYSGYLNITNSKAKMMSHYFFFPSQSGNSSDPVLLWLNGGPGCSSLMGASQENGPWVFKENSTEIILNPYSWNKNAHVIYIESPPGVGYSTTTDKNWNDDKTAIANLQSILKFFELYPEYQQNEFYISGESYAGMYIPYLSRTILKHNRQSFNKINLQGILVGNACTDPLECTFNTVTEIFNYATMVGQGWYSVELQKEFKKFCGDYINPDMKKLKSVACQAFYLDKISPIGYNVNNYNIIGTCWHQNIGGNNSKGQMTRTRYEALQYWKQVIREAELENLNEEEEQQIVQRRMLSDDNDDDEDNPFDCTDGLGPSVFFNDPAVKAALHVDQSLEWVECTNNIKYKRNKNGSLDIYPGLIEAGLRVWIYSGDTDGNVPLAGTLYWMEKLIKQQQYSDIVSWRSWYTEGVRYGFQPGNRQNAGQYWKTEGITLVTHKGCGHMVPIDNPVSAYFMAQNFLKGQDLPAY